MISTKLIAGGALALAMTCGVASAQVASITTTPAGRLFVYHAPARAGCPALDWHVTVGPNNSLSGMVGWNNMEAMARVTGNISADGVVNMTAKEVGGKDRTATITGKLRPDGWIFADVKGQDVNCQGVAVSYYTAPAGGSGGGG